VQSSHRRALRDKARTRDQNPLAALRAISRCLPVRHSASSIADVPLPGL
jgi:hypothetical protein